jgi:hypothetical protein
VPGVRRLHITLELVPGTDPLRGHVRGETATRGFTGWMQLITALQAVIEQDQTDLSTPGRSAAPSARPDHEPDV